MKEYPYSLHWIHRIRGKYVSGHPNKDADPTIKESGEILAPNTVEIRKQNFNRFIDDIAVALGHPSKISDTPIQDTPEDRKMLEQIIKTAEQEEDRLFEQETLETPKFSAIMESRLEGLVKQTADEIEKEESQNPQS